VLLNLAVNARDAMTDGGVLTIETSQTPVYSAPSGEGTQGAANRRPQVYLRVTDSGAGMDEETLSHIFEPFFTTKPLGRGTGLGLATVHGIVTQAGGSISVRSQPGKGATFEVCFPASFTEEETSDSDVRSVNTGSRGETILLAEDDLAVRHFVSRQIQDLGYQLLEAKDAEEAIRTAASYRGPIDLLVTDVVMPNMSGIRLAEVLCQQRAEMRVLFMSGYSQEIVNRGNRTGELPFLLQKPFSPAGLAVAIREAILRRKVTASATV
jgi:two-component system, cell cycle sensor histidine kinase and response regulator CckA